MVQKAKEQEKKKPVDIQALAKRLQQGEPKKTSEGLDNQQKNAGQLGPTEKVKNNNVGKLVGANENADPLLRIKNLSGINK